jgi:hypothetical protein
MKYNDDKPRRRRTRVGRSNKKAERSEPFVLFWFLSCVCEEFDVVVVVVVGGVLGVFFIFHLIYLLFWGDITRRPAIAQFPKILIQMPHLDCG